MDEDYLIQIFPPSDDESGEDKESSLSKSENVMLEVSPEVEGAATEEGNETFTEYHSIILPRSIILREQKAKGIAHQLWPAARSLLQYLEENINEFIPDPSKTVVLELGAGIGLCGLFCSSYGCSQVLLSDLPEAIETLNFNINHNDLSNNTTATILRWGNTDDIINVSCNINNYLHDRINKFIILASDCVYWENLFLPFFNTICHFVRLGGIMIMTHIRRWKKVNRFFDLFKKVIDIKIQKVKELIEMEFDQEANHFVRKVTRTYVITQNLKVI